MPPIIEKRSCIYHFYHVSPPIFWFSHPIFLTSLRQCQVALACENESICKTVYQILGVKIQLKFIYNKILVSLYSSPSLITNNFIGLTEKTSCNSILDNFVELTKQSYDVQGRISLLVGPGPKYVREPLPLRQACVGVCIYTYTTSS